MDEEETKNCPNCKREIPAVNFTIHTVHCARNIKVCPVCKEPVPAAELDAHHKNLHKLLPCKQCGESVCGTDLEDHIRDSCANTIKTCRFCELELPRREIPAHEGYCGVRTEQCSECREYVMIKYRQLHMDSNHGFIRLDDDPAPTKKEPTPRVRAPPQPPEPVFTPYVSSPYGIAAVNRMSQTGGVVPRANSAVNSLYQPSRPTSFFDDAESSNYRNGFLRNQVRHMANNAAGSASANSSDTSANSADASTVSPDVSTGNSGASASQDRPVSNGVKKRTNDQPQINTNTGATKKVDKDLSMSRGAVKKRPAPAPPRADPRRDMPYYSASLRRQREDKERMEQNIYNLAHGLPPVLNPAAKLEKLRKMDALHNREMNEPRRHLVRVRDGRDSRDDRDGRDDRSRVESTRDDFKNLKPMSPEQFMARFSALQLQGGGAGAAPAHGEGEGAGAGAGAEGAGAEPEGDRFSEIKSSLRELRRGLNEVTAPYNNNNNTANNNNERRRAAPAAVRLPCEFCAAPVPADDLVQHQTGCRPDLAQFWGAQVPTPPAAPLSPPSPLSPGASREVPSPPPDPVIPCEFCAQSLPVYLITEHQERCAREVDILSAD